MRARTRRRDERGAAIADFVIVTVALLPIFGGILQLALVLHVRNVLTAAASEGARVGAAYDRAPEDGTARAREEISSALKPEYAADVSYQLVSVGGAPAVRVVVHATVPAFGLGGPGVPLTVSGTAVEEDVE